MAQKTKPSVAEKPAVTAVALLSNKALQAKMSSVAPPQFDVVRQYEFASALAKVFDASRSPVSPRSVVACMYTATSLGLSLNAVKGEAYLVPFAGTCTFIPGYKGLIRLMRQAGLKDIQAKIVWGSDKFSYWEDDSGVHYRLEPVNTKERGEPAWGISRAVLADGTVSCLVVPYHKIESIRQAALARTPKSPWKDYEEEMAQKTLIRMHSKTLPVDDKVATAVHWDEKVELNDTSAELPSDLATIIGEEPEVAPETARQEPDVDSEQEPNSTLVQKLNGIKVFLSKEEVESGYADTEKSSGKKRDAFGDKENERLLKALERKLDE